MLLEAKLFRESFINDKRDKNFAKNKIGKNEETKKNNDKNNETN
jgi:hypothetical protein